MKKIFLTLIVSFLTFSTQLIADTSNTIKRIYEGNKDAKVTIITYESFTCGHCADFHKNVYPQLKKEFIDAGLVKIEFRHFPLDMAALNASKIAQCNNDGKSDILHFLFSNQKKWAIGQSAEASIENLKKNKINHNATNSKYMNKIIDIKNDKIKKSLIKLSKVFKQK